MVVPVLITSCQVSEKLKNGAVTAHTTIIPSAKANTQARPASRDVTLASSENSLVDTYLPMWRDAGTNVFRWAFSIWVFDIGVSQDGCVARC
jgi:hypothetical protein